MLLLFASFKQGKLNVSSCSCGAVVGAAAAVLPLLLRADVRAERIMPVWVDGSGWVGSELETALREVSGIDL